MTSTRNRAHHNTSTHDIALYNHYSMSMRGVREKNLSLLVVIHYWNLKHQ